MQIAGIIVLKISFYLFNVFISLAEVTVGVAITTKVDHEMHI